MAFTDHSDLFGSVHEDALNLVVRHIMRQRPSLFNYATPIFHERPDLFCEKIEVAQTVLDAGNPVFTEQAPLPIPGTPIPVGLNFCLQLTSLQVDFHPGNVFDMPPELNPLEAQRVALRLQACAGLDCPSTDALEEVLQLIEEAIFLEQLEAGELEEGKETKLARARAARAGSRTASNVSRGLESLAPAAFEAALPPADVLYMRSPDPRVFFLRSVPMAGFQPAALAPFPAAPGRDEEVIVLPTRELTCFCLELFAAGHFEWGEIAGSEQQWLKPRLDGIEIVDLQPTPMENSIECYLATVLRLGVLPNLMVPMEKMILDITATLADQGLQIGQLVTLSPAAVPGDVPNNPAIEEDQVKVFINLNVTEGGS